MQDWIQRRRGATLARMCDEKLGMSNTYPFRSPCQAAARSLRTRNAKICSVDVAEALVAAEREFVIPLRATY